ncbi:MAG TPA: FAD-dependent oxidoreductase, partial [Gammaproteobacteria bacterium]
MNQNSYWLESTPSPQRTPLAASLTADVAVIGAGIVGLTAALELARAGKRVVVIDMQGIGHGTSGHTTGKITLGHGLIYRNLTSRHDAKTAAQYAHANTVALRWIEKLVESENIPCDFEHKANYVYCETRDGLDAMLEEVEAAKNAGVKAKLVRDMPLPFEVSGGVMIENQAQFHARKYLLHLAGLVEAAGGVIHEGTRATAIDTAAGVKVETDGGTITAGHVVMATHYPFTDRGLFFARVRPMRSYVVAGPVDPARAPEGMFINSGNPVRSIRTIPDGGRVLLAVAGNNHSVGEDYDTEENYRDLAGWAKRHFGVDTITHRWSAQDGVTVDGIPYAGTAWRSNDTVFTATGFAKWGLTNGTASALLIARAILGYKSDYAWLYDPHRLTLESSVAKFTRDNARVGYHFIHDRFRHPQEGKVDKLSPGEACVAGQGNRQIAAFRDETGRLHLRSARCTHLGCTVTWNG